MNTDAIARLLGQHYAPDEQPAFLGVMEMMDQGQPAAQTAGPTPLGVSGDMGMKQYTRRLAREMFGRGHWDELNQLVSHESSWNPQADNPTSTAYGLFQFLDSTRDNYDLPLNASWQEQVDAGLKYIQNRYQNPTQAWDFWQANNYY